MDDTVRIEIEVSPEAAAELAADDERRRRVGEFVSRLVRPVPGEPDPLIELFKQTQQDAIAAGLSADDVEAELAAYNAERRS